MGKKVPGTFLPAIDEGAPGEAGAKGIHHDYRAVFQLAFLIQLVQSNRNRGHRRIPVFLNIYKNLFPWELQPIARGINDPYIRLMRNQIIHIFPRQSGPIQCFDGRLPHPLYGVLETPRCPSSEDNGGPHR